MDSLYDDIIMGVVARTTARPYLPVLPLLPVVLPFATTGSLIEAHHAILILIGLRRGLIICCLHSQYHSPNLEN